MFVIITHAEQDWWVAERDLWVIVGVAALCSGCSGSSKRSQAPGLGALHMRFVPARVNRFRISQRAVGGAQTMLSQPTR